MTILNVGLWEHAVCILTDTLTTSGEKDHAPGTFVNKVYSYPHMQCVVTGIGLTSLIVEWATDINGPLACRDVRHLDEFTPVLLREKAVKYRAEGGGPVKTTISHFGYDKVAGRFIGFDYNEEYGFQSMPIQYGVTVHPDPGDYTIGDISFPETFIKLAKHQKRRVAKLGQGQVGGQLIATTMEEGARKGEIVIATGVCHEFPDFPKLMDQLATRMPGGGNSGSVP